MMQYSGVFILNFLIIVNKNNSKQLMTYNMLPSTLAKMGFKMTQAVPRETYNYFCFGLTGININSNPMLGITHRQNK